MARTRNFDPGRDRALHYASTRWQRHAKRLVYAYLIVASLPVGLGAVGQGQGSVASLPVGQGRVASLPVGQGRVASLPIGQGRVASLPVGQGRVASLPVGQGRVASLPVGQGRVASLHVGQGAENIAVGQRTEGGPCVACQALSITPAQIAVLPRALNGALVVVRVAPGTPASAWSVALADIRALGGRAGLHVTAIPAEDDPLLAADADTFVIEADGSDVDRVAFELKRALAAARGKRPAASLLIAAAPDVIAALRERGVAPYASAFIDPPSPVNSADDVLRAETGAIHVREAPASAIDANAVASALAFLQPWFPEGLVPVRDRELRCGGDRPVPTFLNPRTLDLVAATPSCARPATVTSDMPGAPVERYDLGAWSAFLVHAGSDTRFAEGVDVAASRTLTVEEIVARHRAAASRQAASIATDIALGTMTLIFEAPGFVAPVTVTADTTVFEDRRQTADHGPARVEVRQANIRVNGVSFDAKGGVPRLPIIEPERVAAPPLVIALSERYRYRLDGRERVRGSDTYVVAFSPRSSGESLF